MLRLASLGLLVIAWFIGSFIAGEQMLPAPTTVLNAPVESGTAFAIGMPARSHR
jgi:hypothetical protein